MFLSYKINSLQSLWARNGLLRLSDKLPHVIKTYLFLPFPISLLIYIKAANSCFKNKKIFYFYLCTCLCGVTGGWALLPCGCWELNFHAL